MWEVACRGNILNIKLTFVYIKDIPNPLSDICRKIILIPKYTQIIKI